MCFTGSIALHGGFSAGKKKITTYVILVLSNVQFTKDTMMYAQIVCTRLTLFLPIQKAKSPDNDVACLDFIICCMPVAFDLILTMQVHQI